MTSCIPLIVAPLLLVLAGCTAAPAPEPTPAAGEPVAENAAPEATPAATAPGAIEADTTVVVTTIATVASGAQLALEMRVHQPIAFDDIANQTLPGAFIESCGATYTAGLFAAEAWSFARANISAVPTAASTADWPSDASVSVLPTATGVPVVGRGMLREGSASASPCTESKSLAGQGNGAIAFGVKGDNGTFRGWTSQRFGFGAGAGVTFSDCAVDLTAVGEQFGGGTSWSTISDAGSCSIGAGG